MLDHLIINNAAWKRDRGFMTIQELKRNDRFKFNDEFFTVTRKFIDDDRPLIAINEQTRGKQKFHWEGLEICKLEQPPAATDTAKENE